MEGKIRGWDITAENVETYEPEKPVECLGIAASEPDIEETTRMYYMLVLIRGINQELKKLGQQGIIITKVYATSETPTGIRMALHLNMEEIKPRLGKRMKFVLDTEHSDSIFARSYREGLEEWKKSKQRPKHGPEKLQ